MQFKDKVIIVTGGTTGIGKATCQQLHAEGAIVYNLDIASASEDDINFIKCDVSDYAQVQKAVKTVVDKHKGIDHLFANAGVHLFANLEATSVEAFEKVLSINVKGVFFCLKAIIPVMKAQKRGSIVLMGSDQSFVGKGSSSAYGLTKGAIGQLTKSTAIDYAEYNIKVNCICPGTIQTPLLDKAVGQFQAISGLESEAVQTILEQAQPIQRIAQPSEIAKVVCFLLSDANSFMTGSLVPVDGGYTCQ